MHRETRIHPSISLEFLSAHLAVEFSKVRHTLMYFRIFDFQLPGSCLLNDWQIFAQVMSVRDVLLFDFLNAWSNFPLVHNCTCLLFLFFVFGFGSATRLV